METKFDSKYLSQLIRNAKKDRKDYYESIKCSRSLYAGNVSDLQIGTSGSLSDTRRLNCWANMVNLLIPAYMNKVPEGACRIKNNGTDSETLTVAKFIEDTVKYEIKEKNNIYRELEHFKKSLIIDSMAILWVRYDYKIQMEVESVQYFNEDTQTYYTEEVEYETLVDEVALIESLNVEDFLTSSGRSYREIEWVAKRSFLTKEEIEQTFKDASSDIKDHIRYDYGETESLSNEENLTYEDYKEAHKGDKTCIWEVWHDKTKKIYYLVETGESEYDLIETKDNTLKTRSKFPCAFLISNLNVDSVIPISDFDLVKDLLVEVESLENRIFNCILAIRLNMLVNSEYQKEIYELFTGDFKIIPIQNASLIEGKSSLRDGFYNYDISPFVNALPVLLNAQERCIKKAEEILGINAILKGDMDARATATTANYENAYTGLRFESRKKEIAMCVTDAYNILADIIFSEFDESTIVKNVNVKHILQTTQPNLLKNDPMDQMIIEEVSFRVLELAREQILSRFKIEVTTDALSSFDEEAFKRERMELVDMGVNSLRALKDLAKETPSAFDAIRTLFVFALRSHKGHKETEGQLLSIFDAMKQEAQNANQEATPNYELQVAEIQRQISEMNNQVKIQQLEMDKYRVDIELEKERMESEVKILQAQVSLKDMELENARILTTREVKTADLMNSREQRQADLLKEEIDTVQERIRQEGKSEKPL